MSWALFVIIGDGIGMLGCISYQRSSDKEESGSDDGCLQLEDVGELLLKRLLLQKRRGLLLRTKLLGSLPTLYGTPSLLDGMVISATSRWWWAEMNGNLGMMVIVLYKHCSTT